LGLLSFAINLQELRSLFDKNLPGITDKIWPDILKKIFKSEFEKDPYIIKKNTEIDSLSQLLYLPNTTPYSNYYDYYTDTTYKYDYTTDSTAVDTAYDYNIVFKENQTERIEYFDEGDPKEKKKDKKKNKKNKETQPEVAPEAEYIQDYSYQEPDSPYNIPYDNYYQTDTMYSYYNKQIDTLRKKIKERQQQLSEEKVKNIGLKPDDFWELFNGDFLFAVTDIMYIEKKYITYEYDEDIKYREVEKTQKEPYPEIILIASVRNKEKLNKVLQTIQNSLTENDYNRLINNADSLGITMNVYDDYWVITNNKLIAEKYTSGYAVSDRLSEPIQKLILENNSTMYINLFQIFNKISLEENLPKQKQTMQLMRNSFKGIYMYSTFTDAPVQTSVLRIDLSNTIDNSLYELLRIIDEVFKLYNY
jgi:hypothetical protein